MNISIGSDHRGYEAKQRVKALLLEIGAKVIDHGTDSGESCDYPDIALAVAGDVARDQVQRGVLFCGSGIGMSITANKVIGVRAALCHDELTAQMSRRHNDANVLCLPADLVGEALMRSIVGVGQALHDVEEVAEALLLLPLFPHGADVVSAALHPRRRLRARPQPTRQPGRGRRAATCARPG